MLWNVFKCQVGAHGEDNIKNQIGAFKSDGPTTRSTGNQILKWKD